MLRLPALVCAATGSLVLAANALPKTPQLIVRGNSAAATPKMR
jgi:hypothetical protein